MLTLKCAMHHFMYLIQFSGYSTIGSKVIKSVFVVKLLLVV